MSMWDFILLGMVGAALALAIWAIVRRKRKGSGCCGHCQGCAGCARYSACGASITRSEEPSK